jgi:hypothetical protein
MKLRPTSFANSQDAGLTPLTEQDLAQVAGGAHPLLKEFVKRGGQWVWNNRGEVSLQARAFVTLVRMGKVPGVDRSAWQNPFAGRPF